MFLLIFALRLLFQNQLLRRLFPVLWCVAAVQPLLPIEIPTHLNIWNLRQGASAMPVERMISETAATFPALQQAVGVRVTAAADTVRFGTVSLIWLGGAVLLGAYFAIGYVCMVQRFRAVRLLLRAASETLLTQFRVSRNVRICRSASRCAPLTFGIVDLTVLLPEDLDTMSEQFRLVLAYELAHIRRRNRPQKLLTVCLCLYCWNPLVWGWCTL